MRIADSNISIKNRWDNFNVNFIKSDWILIRYGKLMSKTKARKHMAEYSYCMNQVCNSLVSLTIYEMGHHLVCRAVWNTKMWNREPYHDDLKLNNFGENESAISFFGSILDRRQILNERINLESRDKSYLEE